MSGFVNKADLEKILMNLDDRIRAAKFKPIWYYDYLGSDFTTTTFGSFVDTPLSVTFTPPIDCYFIPTTMILVKSSAANNLYCFLGGGEGSYFPVALQVSVPANSWRTLNITRRIELNALTPYTLIIKVMQSSAGTLTVYSNNNYTKLEGFLVAR